MNLGTKNIRGAGFRKRIWDVYSGYYCSIVGTCLRRDELRKIARKKVFDLTAEGSDFELHTKVVGLAAENSARAKALHTLLDAKYQSAVIRYSRVKTDEAIETLWRLDVTRGAIAGAFWAIMTHLAPSADQVHRIYGEIHMLGHDFLGDHQRNLQQIQELREKNGLFQDILVSERQHFLRQRTELEERVSNYILMQKNYALLEKENVRLVREKTMVQTSVLENNSLEMINKFKSQIVYLRQCNAIHCADIDKTNESLRSAESVISDLEEINSRLGLEKEEQRRELISLEAALILKNSASECGTCELQESGRCPGPDLCGKKILYVGGLHKMVPHYQQLVESQGGQFMHHDGGVEVARNLLPKMLGSADIVFCPVDCVSHDACTCVKKMCKHYQKPFVMMRSSGLSTLARELECLVH
jgi:hypothetical protein